MRIVDRVLDRVSIIAVVPGRDESQGHRFFYSAKTVVVRSIRFRHATPSLIIELGNYPRRLPDRIRRATIRIAFD
ncbi:hypothetical protein [Burkholderia anthina]|uniref:hypothetical protein n=1 Tax=Burkholderia anthina TaxID=179879 RepID=UPI0012DA6863|nr:hypothetical protein [Burkholderia anthina]